MSEIINCKKVLLTSWSTIEALTRAGHIDQPDVIQPVKNTIWEGKKGIMISLTGRKGNTTIKVFPD